MYIDINAKSLYVDLSIFQQDECFCLKLGMEVEYAKSNLKTSLSQILVICELLPFVSVGQSFPSDYGEMSPTRVIPAIMSRKYISKNFLTSHIEIKHINVVKIGILNYSW